MNNNTLEALATQLVDGDIDVQRAQVLVDAELRSEGKRPDAILRREVTVMEDGEIIESRVYNWNVVHPARKAVVNDPPAKVKAEAPDEVEVFGVWESRSDDVLDSPMWPLPAGKRYKLGKVSKWGCAPVLGSEIALANERTLEMNRQWDRESFLVDRSPLLKAEPGDEDHGYRCDPRRTKNAAQLEREYGPKRVEKIKDVVRDEYGDAVNTPGHGFQFVMVEVTRQGSVGWGYDRLTKKIAGKPAGLPWISPHCHCRTIKMRKPGHVCTHVQAEGTANTFKWIKDQERKLGTRQKQRAAIIALLRKIDRDPYDPAVSGWVTASGYDAAMACLIRWVPAREKLLAASGDC